MGISPPYVSICQTPRVVRHGIPFWRRTRRTALRRAGRSVQDVVCSQDCQSRSWPNGGNTSTSQGLEAGALGCLAMAD
ncbi:hypothetical protein J6590_040190 [Homalodisca vitripennis]|nr:hypothetical protein J6590_040190 [Homalodisca vitripennis]